jgi:hypothetical protein
MAESILVEVLVLDVLLFVVGLVLASLWRGRD